MENVTYVASPLNLQQHVIMSPVLAVKLFMTINDGVTFPCQSAVSVKQNATIFTALAIIRFARTANTTMRYARIANILFKQI